MPTTRPRHSVTESDEVAAALREAAQRWPEDRDFPGKLLLHLVDVGREALRRSRDEEVAARRRRIRTNAGLLSSTEYPKGYLAELREDWPE